jgi:CubicO group peptidase (beta-lactamase class C family)
MTIRHFIPRYLLILFCISLVQFANAQQNLLRLDTFYKALNEENKINGNVLVAEHGKILLTRSFGYQDTASGKLNNQFTRFNLASASKPFTAVAIFQLIERGKLKLNDHYTKFLPDFPFTDITIKHLLSHTAGLPNTEELFTPLLKSDSVHQVTNSDVIPALKNYNKPLHFIPGDKYEYGNTEFCLLALLVEKLSGESFGDYLKKHIFDPAGMKSTTLQKSSTDVQAVRYIQPLVYKAQLKEVSTVADLKKWTYNWAGLTGQGNILSTVGDMLLFDQALYNGKLVKQQSLNQMFTPIKLNNGKVHYFRAGIDEASYGLGWFIFRDATAGKVVWHSGGIPGINTFFLRNLSKKQVIITTDNAQNATIAPETYIILNNKPFQYKKSLARAYVNLLLDRGGDDAITFLSSKKADAAYQLSEGELNFFGLKLFDDGHPQQALEALKINALLFPESFNVYDSYAEVLLKNGKKDAAIVMYQKSIDLNPKNEGAKKVLREIGTPIK